MLGARIIENFGAFITVGEGNKIKIYKKNNYEFIKEINNVHTDDIEGINILNNIHFLTYSWDITIKIWKFD